MIFDPAEAVALWHNARGYFIQAGPVDEVPASVPNCAAVRNLGSGKDRPPQAAGTVSRLQTRTEGGRKWALL